MKSSLLLPLLRISRFSNIPSSPLHFCYLSTLCATRPHSTKVSIRRRKPTDHRQHSHPRPALPVEHSHNHAASFTLPDIRKSKTEDAHLLLHRNNLTLLAIFDGVGSWAFEKNIDASLFSSTMALATQKAFECDLYNVKNLLRVAAEAVHQKVVGSSTALIGLLNHLNGSFESVSIGDSAYYILRLVDGRYEIVHESKQQIHYFNCPAQLGFDPSKPHIKYDSVEEAVFESLTLQKDDLLIMTSDGFHDNVTMKQFVEIVNRHAQLGKVEHEMLSKELSHLAFELSHDNSIDSPFALQAKENNICWREGGRKDDITVLVSSVTL